jgi:excisionase family DNA binding protein
VATPTREERDALVQAHKTLLELTKPLTAAAADRGVSYMTLYRQIAKGEVDAVTVGRDVRVWRDEPA